MTAGAFFLVGALSCGACVAMGLVVCGIVLDHRDRAARPLEAPGLARAVVEPATALAGVLPQTPAPAGAAIAAVVSAIQARELDETLPTLPPPLPIAEPSRAADHPVAHL